ncbi:MAG TPA: DUF433 domain-containing protein [Pyrinomonadaceae bacterium]|nr:DUF433 domain-containing protein [Pyrinomonadaceae bacterium]
MKKVKDYAAEGPVAPAPADEGRLGRLLKRVTVDPQTCHGQPCIRGLRIMVSVVVNSLRAGMSYDDLLLRYPDLTRDDIDAAVAYTHAHEN